MSNKILPVNQDAMAQALRKDLERRTASLKTLFASEIGATDRYVTKAIFEAYFLPWFSGETKDESGALYNHWVTIAGSPFDPVLIKDENNETIAVVPPLKDRDVVPVKLEREGNSLEFIFMQAANMAMLSPKAAMNQLAGTLHGRYNTSFDQNHLTKTQAAWIELLAKFGKGQKVLGQAGTQPIGGQDDGVEMVYD